MVNLKAESRKDRENAEEFYNELWQLESEKEEHLFKLRNINKRIKELEGERK